MKEIRYPGSRGGGKTARMREQIEELLDSGKRVLVINKDSMVAMRRRKHLTLIETVPRSPQPKPKHPQIWPD